METEPGAYTVRDGEVVEGLCAGCLEPVNAGDFSVVRYHPTERGGIFHQRCEPLSAGWYSIDA